jgi:CRISPR-associated protein Csb2
MPPFKGNTTKVLDTFAVIDRVDAPLYVRWPEDLSAEEAALLKGLLESLPYLGRAESWIKAELADAAPATGWIEPNARAGEDSERVDLLSPLSPEALKVWREDALARALQQRLSELSAAGKKAALKPADRKKIEDSLPQNVFAALTAETGVLQRAGWSIPPGTKWLSYWRPADALERPPSPSSGPIKKAAVTAVLYAVSSETRSGATLPPLKDSLRRAEMIHKALVARATEKHGNGEVQLSGQRLGAPAKGHRHPSVFCASLACIDGRSTNVARASIDHVLVCAHPDAPFDDLSLVALRSLQQSFARGAGTLWLTRLWELSPGEKSQFPLLANALAWESHTPYFAPRHIKRRGKNSLEGQIHSELEQRGVSGLRSVEVSVERDGQRQWLPAKEFFDVWRAPATALRLDTRWRTFQRDRRSRETPQPIHQQPALGIRLTFAEAVRGPVAAGYGSHMGLGLFSAAR